MRTLRENPILLWLTPLLSLAGIAISQIFLYPVYLEWVVWKVITLYITMGIGLFFFFAWAGALIYQKDSKKGWLFTILSTVLTIAVGLLISLIINNLAKAGNTTAMTIEIILIDFYVFAVFGVAFVALLRYNKKLAIGALAGTLVVVVGFTAVAIQYILYKESSSYIPETAYKQTFTISDSMKDGEGQKVKVVLLGGQSNASGVSSVEYLAKNASADKFAEYSTGYDNVMINYFTENGANASFGFTNVKTGQGCTSLYYGPELGMADYLSKAFPEENVIIIKYSWGGSNLYEQWKAPTAKNPSAGPLYKAFVNFVTAGMDVLAKNNYDAKICAMCWMQGESDSDDTNAPNYGANEKALIESLRTDLSPYISDDGMTFVDAGISDSQYWKNHKVINASKKALVSSVSDFVYIDTIAAGLDYKVEPEGSPDLAHYDSMSQIKLGNLFGEAIVESLTK